MSRIYYCEYCDKRFKDNAKIRKKHIDGLAHQTARKAHYAKFKDPKEILDEETQKKFCTRFQAGFCQFGASCRFSHYTPDQLNELNELVKQNEFHEWMKRQPKQYSRDAIDDFMRKRATRKRNEVQAELRQMFGFGNLSQSEIDRLPPSLRVVDPEKMPDKIKFWG